MMIGKTLTGVAISLESDNSITGRVLDYDGNPVAGAQIFEDLLPFSENQRNSEKVLVSDANGQLSLGGITRGRRTFSAFKPGLVPDQVTVDIAGVTNIEFILRKGGSVEGVVVLEGEGVPGRMIRGVSSGDRTNPDRPLDFTGWTDDEGRFRITGIPEGTVDITISMRVASRQRVMKDRIEVFNDTTTEVNFTFGGYTSSVEGYYMVSETQPGSENARICISTDTDQGFYTTEIESDGYFHFPFLSSGSFSMYNTVRGEGRMEHVEGQVGVNETLRLDILAYGGATVNCIVTDAPRDKTILALVTPTASLKWDRAKVSKHERYLASHDNTWGGEVKDGVFTIYGLETGDYTLFLLDMTLFSAYRTGNFSEDSMKKWPSTRFTLDKEAEYDVELSYYEIP